MFLQSLEKEIFACEFDELHEVLVDQVLRHFSDREIIIIFDGKEDIMKIVI